MAYRGKYIPVNKKKYRGDWRKITYRSSWELKFCIFADNNANVLKWSSEEVVIPYRCRTDNKMHRYYMDFWMRIIDKNGEIKDKLIEIKPYAQTQKPIYKKGTSAKNYNKRVYAYAKNISKWEATQKFIKDKNMEFHILTEHELGITLGPSLKHKKTKQMVRKRS